ncbi:MAG: hypothetical protein JSS07_02725 [Proteobacteria bacterium]|nr:hypothetical protein [Pseudomonadota bacterium]
MFNIGFGELCLVGVVALWALGPKQLSFLARLFARWFWRMKQSYQNIKMEISQEYYNAKDPD